MPLYRVQMTRLAVVFREEEVEAKSEAHARKEALDIFGDDESGWKVDALYDDGKSYCATSVNEVELIDADADGGDA